MISLRSLRVKNNQQLTPGLWNRLLLAIDQRTPRRGIGTRLRSTPSGVTISGRRRAGSSGVLTPWQMSLDGSTEAGVLGTVRFERGLVAGIEARIGEHAVSEVDEKTNLTPALPLRRADFGEDHLARIYAVARFNPMDFTLQKVEMAVRPVTPKTEAWSAFKLIGFAVLEGEEPEQSVRLEQMCFFNLAVLISKQRTSAGAATYAFVAS